jgi:hypothetical protein
MLTNPMSPTSLLLASMFPSVLGTLTVDQSALGSCPSSTVHRTRAGAVS